jgi:hypothetical protein
MNSPFKFLRRVRIHGGECGAVARALHHEAQKVALTRNEQSLISDEKVFLSQADLGKSSGSTFIERKQMSIKTTFKRIALVLVAALGFGTMSAVAPANAVVPTSITFGTVPAFKAGVMSKIPVTFTLPAGTSATTDSLTFVARVTSAPAASAAISAAASGGGSIAARTSSAATSSILYFSKPSAPTSGAYGLFGSWDYNDAVNTGSTDNWTVGNTYALGSGDLTGQVTLNLELTPDVAGSYTILVAVGNAPDLIATLVDDTTANLASRTSASVSLTTADSPTTVTLTPVNATAATTVASGGSLLKVTTGSALLAAGESITLSGSSSTVTFSDSILTNGDFTAGVAYVNVYNTAEETVTISAAQSGTLTGMSSGATSIKFVAGATSSTAVIGVTPSQTTYVSATAGGTDDLRYTASTTRTTQTICITDSTVATATAEAYSYLKFTDDSGRLTGKAGSVFAVPVTIAASATAASRYGCATVSGTLQNSDYFTVNALSSNATDQLRVTGATRTASTVSVTPTTTLLVATGSSNAFTATVKDQFGAAIAGRTINISLVGRNAKAVADAITDASGQVSYTVADTGTAGTTDTLTFTDSSVGTATKAVTITYGTVTVTTMTLTGGDTTAGVTSSTKSVKDIAAGATGATAGVQTITATIKDATGALMAGVPVTWTVAGSGAAIRSTGLTSYSTSTGTASTTVYAWLAGTYTVTASAGGKTATAEITFGQTSASEARTVSATSSGSIVTAKVVDRFGNPISGVTVYASRVSGTGYFGSGVTKTYTTTGQDGTAEFAVTGGDASIKVSTLSYDAVAGTKPSDQTCARKGAVDCNDAAADDTLFTATTVGTATTGETGVGASYDAAGVNSATVSLTGVNTSQIAAEAATDAAAEAIDAANAATDAANLAAEAADAATVAAEEARDAADAATAAVEELATQVATLMAALKAQITTLANTVAKIAKKVKA